MFLDCIAEGQSALAARGPTITRNDLFVRSEGFKPRGEGFKPSGERSEGFKARGDRPGGFKPRAERGARNADRR